FTLTPPGGVLSGKVVSGTAAIGRFGSNSAIALAAPAVFQMSMQYSAKSAGSNGGYIGASIARAGDLPCDFLPVEGKMTPTSGACQVDAFAIETARERGEDSSGPDFLAVRTDLKFYTGSNLFIVVVFAWYE